MFKRTALAVGLLAAFTFAQAEQVPEVIGQVWKAAGGESWPGVKRIRFTFNVEEDGKLKLSAKHDWDVAAGRDTVTVGDKAVTVDLADGKHDGEAEKKAFQRWTNDGYWLLMPLKLKDGGVHFGPVTTTGTPPERAEVTMSFGDVGLTPGDQYDLSIDLKTHCVVHWFYRPNDKTKAGFTWDGYQTFNGLTLATNHKSDDGKRRIYFTDVSVDR